MILTVTMNPSVDIGYQLEQFHLDDVNRVADVSKTAGGKGLNVTRVAHDLSLEVMATGILGGTIGGYITRQLTEQGIRHRFYQIEQESRNCIAILHEGKQTEILESGPTISPQEAEGFLAHFKKLLDEEPVKVLTISGSLPKGLTPAIYKQMIQIANQKEIPVVLDTSGPTLEAVLADPTLRIAALKPNRDELSALEKQELSHNPLEWKEILESKRYQQIEWLIISMGGAGAFAKHGTDYYRVQIPAITVVNPVGSGDATVAGIAKGLAQQLSPEDLLKTAMTTGMLNTMEQATGSVNPVLFDEYFEKVSVTIVKEGV